MAKPIFILGRPRSGTTWLSNILCGNDKIVGVQDKRHFGICESYFFSKIANMIKKIEDKGDYQTFLQIFTNSDYYIIGKRGVSNFVLARNYENVYNFFRMFMENIANRNNALFWLEKTPEHVLYLQKILKTYPDSIFIYIERDLIDTVKSAIASLNPKIRLFVIFRTIFLHCLYYKILNKFESSNEKITFKVDYWDLKVNKENTVKEICNFLRVNYNENMLENKYQENTSFKNQKDRKTILKLWEAKLIMKFHLLLNLLPFQIFMVFQLIIRQFYKKTLPKWYFSLYKEKLGIKTLVNERGYYKNLI